MNAIYEQALDRDPCDWATRRAYADVLERMAEDLEPGETRTWLRMLASAQRWMAKEQKAPVWAGHSVLAWWFNTMDNSGAPFFSRLPELLYCQISMPAAETREELEGSLAVALRRCYTLPASGRAEFLIEPQPKSRNAKRRKTRRR